MHHFKEYTELIIHQRSSSHHEYSWPLAMPSQAQMSSKKQAERTGEGSHLQRVKAAILNENEDKLSLSPHREAAESTQDITSRAC